MSVEIEVAIIETTEGDMASSSGRMSPLRRSKISRLWPKKILRLAQRSIAPSKDSWVESIKIVSADTIK